MATIFLSERRVLREGNPKDPTITSTANGTPYVVGSGDTLVITAHERPVIVRLYRAIALGEFRVQGAQINISRSKRNFYYEFKIAPKKTKRFTVRYIGTGFRKADQIIGLLVKVAVRPDSDKPSHYTIAIHS